MKKYAFGYRTVAFWLLICLLFNSAYAFSAPSSLPINDAPNTDKMCPAHDFALNGGTAGEETDVCTICGYIRMHNMPINLRFIVLKDNAPLRNEPRSTGITTRTLSVGDVIAIKGRVRNEKNHLFLYTTDNDYIYSENTAFDFDTTLAQAFQLLLLAYESEDVDWNKIESFLEYFRTGGVLDFKSTDVLGGLSGKQSYYIFANGRLLNSRLTAERIGNIVYGFEAAALGIDREQAIKCAGVGLAVTDGSVIDGIKCGVFGQCDSDDDIQDIYKGWDYYHTSTLDIE